MASGQTIPIATATVPGWQDRMAGNPADTPVPIPAGGRAGTTIQDDAPGQTGHGARVRFVRFDLQAAIASDPLFASFDPVTHRFRGTPSEMIDPAEIARRLATLEADLTQLRRRALTHLESGMASPPADESAFWTEQQRLDRAIDDLRGDQLRWQERAARDGRTPDSSIVPMVASMVARIQANLPHGPVVLVPLPLPTRAPAALLPVHLRFSNPLRRVFDGEPGVDLTRLRQEAWRLLWFMPGCGEPVLYDRRNEP